MAKTCKCGCGKEVRREYVAGHHKRRAYPDPPYRINGSGCWEWLGSVGNHGYGVADPERFGVPRIEGRKVDTTHRIWYRKYKGEIPDGYFVLHDCDNPVCINPEHLRVGLPADNSRDMQERGRRIQRMCRKGLHELTPENIYDYPEPDGKPHRLCKECARQRNREYKARKRAGAVPVPPAENCKRGHPLSGANLAISTTRAGREVRICKECARQRNREYRARKAMKGSV